MRDGGRVVAPVEYKKGKRRHFENDDVQLCAQALCLEEMFQAAAVPRGFIFHAGSKRRREVGFTAELRATTEEAVTALRSLVASAFVPFAVLKPQCAECSLCEICLPELTSRPPAMDRAMRRLFEAA